MFFCLQTSRIENGRHPGDALLKSYSLLVKCQRLHRKTETEHHGMFHFSLFGTKIRGKKKVEWEPKKETTCELTQFPSLPLLFVSAELLRTQTLSVLTRPEPTRRHVIKKTTVSSAVISKPPTQLHLSYWEKPGTSVNTYNTVRLKTHQPDEGAVRYHPEKCWEPNNVKTAFKAKTLAAEICGQELWIWSSAKIFDHMHWDVTRYSCYTNCFPTQAQRSAQMLSPSFTAQEIISANPLCHNDERINSKFPGMLLNYLYIRRLKVVWKKRYGFP